MPVIESGNQTLKATASVAESTRQGGIAAAKAAGGGSAAIQAAVKAAEITYYKSLVATAKANGQQHAQFIQALTWLGAIP